MFQFTDIPRPRQLLQPPGGSFTEARQWFLIVLTEMGHETESQRHDVLLALPKSGQVEVDGVDAIEQILPETALSDHLLQITVGSRDEAHLNRDRVVATHGGDVAALQGGQQLGLQVIGQVANLVEKECAAVGCDELTRPIGMGIGESPFYMAEQLALEKALGQGTHIHRD